MANAPQPEKSKGWARAFEVGRNLNALATAVGAVAIVGFNAVGAGVAAAAAEVWTLWNAAQTVALEGMRRIAKKRQAQKLVTTNPAPAH